MKCNISSVNIEHRRVLGLVCVSKIKVMFKFFHKLCSYVAPLDITTKPLFDDT